jgi:ABC-type branched-subunit amino acid transport system substrate-binding protein
MRGLISWRRVFPACVGLLFSSALCHAADVSDASGQEERGGSLSGAVIGYLQMGDHARAWAEHQQTGEQPSQGAEAFALAAHAHVPREQRRAWIGEVSSVLPWVPRFCALESREALDRDQRSEAIAAGQWGLRGALPASPIAEELHALLEEARLSRPVDMQKLGVLLPLSGRFKGLGQSALASLKLALDKEGSTDFVVRDTRGDSTRSRELALELANQEGVGAVLGPVGSGESSFAAEALSPLGVPHVLLSRQDAPEDQNACAVTVRLTRRAEVLALVQLAVEERDATRYAILREDSLHGAAMSDALRAAVGAHGGVVVADLVLPPMGSPKALSDFEALDVLKETAGETRIDALFLPVQARAAHRILPYLRARGVRFSSASQRGLLLLGSSQWDVRGVVDPAEATTLGALYPTGYGPRPGDGPPSEFQRAFEGMHGVRPSSRDAEIYDAARLALGALAAARVAKTGRTGACAALRGVEAHPGATGVLRVLPSGGVSRVVTIREVQARGTRALARVRVSGKTAVVEVLHERP